MSSQSSAFSTAQTLKHVVQQGHVFSSQKKCASCYAQLQQHRPVVLGAFCHFAILTCRIMYVQCQYNRYLV